MDDNCGSRRGRKAAVAGRGAGRYALYADGTTFVLCESNSHRLADGGKAADVDECGAAADHPDESANCTALFNYGYHDERVCCRATFSGRTDFHLRRGWTGS